MSKKMPYRTPSNHAEGRSLGLNMGITRRDFLGSTLIGCVLHPSRGSISAHLAIPRRSRIPACPQAGPRSDRIVKRKTNRRLRRSRRERKNRGRGWWHISMTDAAHLRYSPVTAPSSLRIRSGLKIAGSMSRALTPMRSAC